jgi:hypothetical protein
MAIGAARRQLCVHGAGWRAYRFNRRADQSRLAGVPQVRAVYAQGHLFYTRERTLVAHQFDPDRAVVTGDAIAVAQSCSSFRSAQASFSVGPDGWCCLRRPAVAVALAGSERCVAWRTGTAGPVPDARISPDGTRVAYPLRRSWQHLIAAVDESSTTRLTFDSTVDRYPVWSPDNKTITYASGQLDSAELMRKAADGTGLAEPLTKTPSQQHSMDWSSDGQYLSFTRNDVTNGTAMHILPMASRTPYVFLQTPVSEAHSQFGPGTPPRWLAYSSDDTGRREIYVAPFIAGQLARRTQADINGRRHDAPLAGRRRRTLLLGAGRTDHDGHGRWDRRRVPSQASRAALSGAQADATYQRH